MYNLFLYNCNYFNFREEEGRDLLGKRTMDFKVSYLDAGLPNSYFTENEVLATNNPQAVTTAIIPTTPIPLPSSTRVNKRYKPQIRDFLSTCRTKRKLNTATNVLPCSQPSQQQQHSPTLVPSSTTATINNPIPANIEYFNPDNTYNMYATNYHASSTTVTPDQNLSPYMSHPAANFYQTAAIDNRYLTSGTDNIYHQFRPLSTYYHDYHTTGSGSPATATSATYPGNSFLDIQARTSACTLSPYDHTASTAYQLTSNNFGPNLK